jgi:RNA polymerase sigma factor (sigma-70 family)
LLERFVRLREEAAFEVLVWRHGPLVLKICRDVLHDSCEAEDAFQAVFLVLARKAGSIGKRESLGSWLYKVTLRIAVKARSRRAKRQAHERSGFEELPDRADNRAAEEEDLRDLRPLLHEEIARLPRKYQAPLILCALEGKTHLQAAQQLGWAKGTVAGRLSRARHMLQQRLQRRGVVHSGALLLTGSRAAFSTSLAKTTTRAAVLFATGKGAGISATALALAEGVLDTMLFTKVKIATCVLVLVAAMGTGIGTLLLGQSAGQDANVPQPAQVAVDKPAAIAARVKTEPRVIRLVSARDGVILVVGSREVKAGDKNPGRQTVTIRYGGENHVFIKLKEGDRVEAGQTLLRLDDRLARNELQIAHAKMNACKADLATSKRVVEEAVARYQTAEGLYNRVPKMIGAEEYREKLLAMQKYKEDTVAKEAAVKVAQLEIQKAEIILDMHIVSSPVRGVIRAIYKLPGEGVKALEPVIEIVPDK